MEALWEQCDRQYSTVRASGVSHDLLLTAYIVRLPVELIKYNLRTSHTLDLPFEHDVNDEIYQEDPDVKVEEITLVVFAFVFEKQPHQTDFILLLLTLCGKKYERKGITYVDRAPAESDRWLENEVKQTMVSV
jgi:hypothetical protein